MIIYHFSNLIITCIERYRWKWETAELTRSASVCTQRWRWWWRPPRWRWRRPAARAATAAQGLDEDEDGRC